MYKTGLVVGKFLPCHSGHHYLIDQAQQQCEDLTVVVVRDWSFDTIPSDKRKEWIQLVHPNVTVKVIPQLYGKDDDSKAWAEYTREFFGKAPDVVFTSEKYGETWAKELGCDHVQVDLARSTHTISGTAIREDPYENWDFLCPPAKSYFTRRICLIGGESVGKTTMAGRLAEHYNTVWCAEYGRFYVERNGLNTQDTGIWDAILVNQPAWEQQTAMAANKVLIVDTDLITTSVWYERWVGERDPNWHLLRDTGVFWADSHYDLYLYLDYNVEWVQDDSRTEGDPDVRAWFGQELIKGAQQTRVPIAPIKAYDYDERFEECIMAISKIMT